jgi:predicted small secreted protein
MMKKYLLLSVLLALALLLSACGTSAEEPAEAVQSTIEAVQPSAVSALGLKVMSEEQAAKFVNDLNAAANSQDDMMNLIYSLDKNTCKDVITYSQAQGATQEDLASISGYCDLLNSLSTLSEAQVAEFVKFMQTANGDEVIAKVSSYSSAEQEDIKKVLLWSSVSQADIDNLFAQVAAATAPTAEPTAAPQLESYRLPGAADWSYYGNEQTLTDATLVAAMDSHATNLAIPAPYTWDIYTAPDSITKDDVLAYFKDVAGAKGYTLARDQEGLNKVYLMTFLGDGGSKVAVQFNAPSSGNAATVMIFYSNPIP